MVDTEKQQYYRFALRQILKIEDRSEFENGGQYKMPDGRELEWEAELPRMEEAVNDTRKAADGASAAHKKAQEETKAARKARGTSADQSALENGMFAAAGPHGASP